MNAVGIDISKGKSMIAVLRPMGEVVYTPFEISHNYANLESLAHSLKCLDGETRAVIEYTGKYFEPVARALQKVGIYVSVVNPSLINNYGNNSLRRVKTDKKDSLKIARYGLDNWHELREYCPMETIRQQLKTDNRQFQLYTKIKIGLKNNFIALLDQTWPGINTFFSSPVRADGRQKWVDFACNFWNSDCVSGISSDVFTEKYRKWCQRCGYDFSQQKAKDIYEKSKGHFNILPKNQNTKLLIKESANALNSISKTAETYRTEMQRLAEQLPEYEIVMAMYGVGKAIGPQLMAEIGDIRRFSHRGALVAYAGVDPQPSQSGKQNRNSNPISRKGSGNIRKLLFQVMVTHLRKSPEDESVYKFLDKKRSEGKPYFVYMTAGSNKFLRIYYGRVKEYLHTLDQSE